MGSADVLIKNAVILTMDGENRRAASLAVKDGRIAGIWEQPDPPIKEVGATSKTEIINLNGATLIPGFVDTHNHILGYSQIMDFVNCGAPPNYQINDILEQVRKKVETSSEGEWIQGFGYDDTALEEQRHLTRDELDAVAPSNPVFVAHVTGHLAIANSQALRLAGIEEDMAEPQDGKFGRDATGRLNGVLYEKTAMAPLAKVIPQSSGTEMVERLGRAAQEYLAQGITMNTDAAVGMFGNAKAELDVHFAAANNGLNPMRTQLMLMHNFLRENEAYAGYDAEQLDQEFQAASNGLVRLDSAKMFQDGSIQALTGALRESYYCDTSERGKLFHDQDDFNAEVLDLHRRGFRITTHGNGDRAIGSILDAYAHALDIEPKARHQHRIEHVQTGTTDDLTRMEELRVAGSFFINHVYFWGKRHKEIFLGPERASRISPLAEAVAHNLLFTLHSDCPVTPISPLFSIWAAVNRLTKEGEVLGADQRIDVMTALKSMTIYGAQLNFAEEEVGSLEVGKKADFAVLEADPTSADPVNIKDIAILATMIDGKVVYDKDETMV